MTDNSDKFLQYAKSLFDNSKIIECIEYITQYTDNQKINKAMIELLLLRGDAYRKINKFGDALRDYHTVVNIDNNNTIAQTKIGIVENILSIENTFYYENAYTDNDLFPEM